MFNDKDNRNRKFDSVHNSKKRENFLEEMERNQKKSIKTQQKIEGINNQVSSYSDDEKLVVEDAYRKAQLGKRLADAYELDKRTQSDFQRMEKRVANTNIKVSKVQIKQGKHKHANEFGMKNDGIMV